MNRARATTIAIAAIEQEIKRLAAAANLHELYGADVPHAIQASKRRKELRDAIEALRQPTQTRF
jgi:hypothetical protein